MCGCLHGRYQSVAARGVKGVKMDFLVNPIIKRLFRRLRPAVAGFQSRQKVVHSRLSVPLVTNFGRALMCALFRCPYSSTLTFHEAQMPLTCRKCGSSFSDKSLDGTIRAVCPVCKTTLVSTTAASEPEVPSPPPLHSLLAERVARKRGDWVEIREEPLSNKPQQLTPLRRRIRQWVVLSSSIFFAFGGIAFGVQGCTRSLEKNATTAWPDTSGKISYCDVREVRLKSRRWWQKETVLYAVDITYAYNVDGIPFQGDRVSVSNLYDKDSAFRKVRKYEVGTNHQVFYNPKHPDASVLEHGQEEGYSSRMDDLLGTGMPIALLLVSLVGFWSLAINAI